MKILLDENLPESLVKVLSERGHEVDSVNDLNLKGIANGELYHSVGEGYDILFTKDKGFANNIAQKEVEQDTKLIHVVIPQKPAREFVELFLDYFQDTNWNEYQNADSWPESYLL